MPLPQACRLLQRLALYPDASLCGQRNARHDVDLEGRIGHHAAALQQLADEDAALDLGEGVADAGARAVAEGEVSAARRGAV